MALAPATIRRLRVWLIWSALLALLVVPVLAAAQSPLLAWRRPVYVAAGFAGIVAMAVMVVQPMLAAGFLPGLDNWQRRRVHRVVGAVLVALVVLHVLGLWLTSPPDVVDALLLVSPTPFSIWGVIAMWAIFGAALLAVLRRRRHLRPSAFRLGHVVLVALAVAGSIVHALLIEGTMEPVSKWVLTSVLGVVALAAVVRVRGWFARSAGKPGISPLDS